MHFLISTGGRGFPEYFKPMLQSLSPTTHCSFVHFIKAYSAMLLPGNIVKIGCRIELIVLVNSYKVKV